MKINLKVNNFATIKHINSYKKVEVYSICLEKHKEEGDEVSLFELFIKKHTQENRTKLNHIMDWLKRIGNDIGAKKFYFRNEAETADTHGLPPKGIKEKPYYLEYNDETDQYEKKPNDLRLYCLRLNDHVIFLFNGDIKTEDKAQDCGNVRPHFKLANKLTKAIDKSIGKGIRWNEDCTDIVIDEEFELNW